MLDVTEISAVIAAAGVLVGVAYYILDMRNQSRVRQTELLARLRSAFTSDDFLTALVKTRNLEFEDYNDFAKKYGSITLETPLNIAVLKIANYFDEVGFLLHRGLVDADLIGEFMTFSIAASWNKLKPLIEGYRKETNSRFSHWFEYLVNEMKKREQAGVVSG